MIADRLVVERVAQIAADAESGPGTWAHLNALGRERWRRVARRVLEALGYELPRRST